MGNIAKGTKVEFEFVFGRENIPDPPKTGRIYFVYDPEHDMQAIQVGNDGELLELASVYSDQDFAEDFNRLISNWKVKEAVISGSQPSNVSYIADAMFDPTTGALVLTRKPLTTQLNQYAKLTGATFTGAVTLSRDPTTNMQAATKRYVDSRVSTALRYLGVSTTPITDGGSQSPTINGEVIVPQNGNIVYYNGIEFIFNGTIWQIMGSPSGDIPRLLNHAGETPNFNSDGALDSSGYSIASSIPMGKFDIVSDSNDGKTAETAIPLTWDTTYKIPSADAVLKTGGLYILQMSTARLFESNLIYFVYTAVGGSRVVAVENWDATHTIKADESILILITDGDSTVQTATVVGGGKYWANTKSGAYRDDGLTFSVPTLKNTTASSPMALGSIKNSNIDMVSPRPLNIYDTFYIQYDGNSSFRFNSTLQFQYVSYQATDGKTYTIRISGISTSHTFITSDVIGIFIAGEIGHYAQPIYYGHVISQSWSEAYADTKYMFAEGTTDGAFSVTLSTGSAQSVSIHGLKQGAFQNNVTLCILESMVPEAGIYTITHANEVGPQDIWQGPMIGEVLNICCANPIANTFSQSETDFYLQADMGYCHLRISNIDTTHSITDGDVFAVVVYDVITENDSPVYLCRQYAQSWVDVVPLVWGTLS